jgi:hypothetical protein
VGVKPQAEAPHSVPVAPRNALRRRLRRRTCTARARAQRHRSVLQARAGPTWESERSSSVARALQGARRKARRSMANGDILGSSSALQRAWSRPQRGGGARARALRQRINGVRTSLLKRLAAALAFSGSPEYYVGHIILGTLKKASAAACRVLARTPFNSSVRPTFFCLRAMRASAPLRPAPGASEDGAASNHLSIRHRPARPFRRAP